MSTQTTYRFEPGASRGWLQHFELSWRALRRAPSFAVPAVVTIALGIGAATAVFSLVYAILLRPFPYPDADRLVRVFTVAEGEQGAERNCSLLDIEDYNRRSSLLENIGGYTVFNSQIEGDGFGEAVVIAQLNQEAMHAVGVQPVLGRLFTEEEDRRGGPVNKALLSHGLWQGRFGGAPDALGKMIRLPMGDFEVVGVMPAGFGYPDRATLWLTMEAWYALGLESYREKQRDQRWYATVARLAPGASVEQAQDEMGEVARQLAAEFPATNRDVGVRLVPLRDAEVGEVRPYLMLLTAGVPLVLLICIFNVANLLVARALTHRSGRWCSGETRWGRRTRTAASSGWWATSGTTARSVTRSSCTTRSRNGRWAAATTSCARVWTRPRCRGRFGPRSRRRTGTRPSFRSAA